MPEAGKFRGTHYTGFLVLIAYSLVLALVATTLIHK